MKKIILDALIIISLILGASLAPSQSAGAKRSKKGVSKSSSKRKSTSKKRRKRRSRTRSKKGRALPASTAGADIGYQAIPKSRLYDLIPITPILARKNSVNQDITTRFGFLPTDAFTKGVLFGASYTIFFSQYLGWEVLNANYTLNIDTKLKSDLAKQRPPVLANESEFGQKLDFFDFYVTTNLVYTPLYIKSLLFNRSLVHGEISFTFGGGIVHYKINGISPTISLGLLFRFYQGLSRSWKLDFRDLVYFRKNSDPVSAFSISIGHSWHI